MYKKAKTDILMPVAVAILAMATSGCAILPNHTFFTPAASNNDSAWVRVVDNTEQTSIYQTLNGKRTGGLIRSSEWVLQNTQDRGMPKVAGEKYDIDYYETPLIAGVETAIVNVFVESKYSCLITTRFIPEKGKKYEVQLETDMLNYQCRARVSEIVQDSQGQWQRQPMKNVSYNGTGQTSMHSSI